MPDLTGKQKRFLRSLGNGIKSTVFVGHNGISESVISAAEDAFNTTELIKVRLQEGFTGDRNEAGHELAGKMGAVAVQILGKTILLFKPSAENPEIKLP
ncbi:MAG: ribosome assembly RNA-binding protein YhbY [Calditrichaeota bacterium]|nr:MAG: ribosome assembly RNA-binding protein YhbY [Calditrichota bacterium]